MFMRFIQQKFLLFKITYNRTFCQAFSFEKNIFGRFSRTTLEKPGKERDAFISAFF
jgi:hypothetical protein